MCIVLFQNSCGKLKFTTMANIRKSFLFPDDQVACCGYFLVLYVIKMFSTFFQVLL